jgi:hypothetical protein
MDALKMAALDAPGTSRSSDSALGCDRRLSPSLREALAILLQAYEYALDLGTSPWDFATEIGTLRRLKLSTSDMRWLVGRGLVEHGIEVTLGGDLDRRFQHPARLLFNKRTCFVLSATGADLAQDLSRGRDVPRLTDACPASDSPALAIAQPPATQGPRWDRNRQELWVGPALVKRFKIPSPPEETILAAFEEMHWPARIDDPLPSGGEAAANWRLQKAIEALNQNQKLPLVRFSGDGTGRGVRWEFSADPRAARER